MSQGNPNKVTRQARITKVIAGIQQFFMGMQVIVLGGKSYTPVALVGLLQRVLDAINQSSSAKAGYEAAVQNERNQIAETAPVLRFIEKFVVLQFGDTQDASQKLDVFGYAPRKVPAKKVSTKSEAIAKAKATRAARGTTGPKQKAKIKGTVPAAEPAPAVSNTPAPIKPGS